MVMGVPGLTVTPAAKATVMTVDALSDTTRSRAMPPEKGGMIAVKVLQRRRVIQPRTETATETETATGTGTERGLTRTGTGTETAKGMRRPVISVIRITPASPTASCHRLPRSSVLMKSSWIPFTLQCPEAMALLE